MTGLPKHGHAKRIIAIDPRTRGFGFVVLEGPDQPVDWGFTHVRQDREKETSCLARLDGLIGRYAPVAIVVEDHRPGRSRRSPRVRRLLAKSCNLARARSVQARSVTRADVRTAFLACGAVTKAEIAAVIAARFREFAPRLPPTRRPGDGEDERMAIFTAASFGLTHFALPMRRRQGRQSPDGWSLPGPQNPT